jgi:hypothetical protein
MAPESSGTGCDPGPTRTLETLSDIHEYAGLITTRPAERHDQCISSLTTRSSTRPDPDPNDKKESECHWNVAWGHFLIRGS